MNKKKKATADGNTTICVNKKARHDYFIERAFEAGIELMGWEVKSLRAGRGQITESYVIIRQNEAWLFNSNITPLPTASTHIDTTSTRTRKLLMHRKELDKLIGLVERDGYTMVPLSLYWKKHHIKAEIGLAKGKKQHDKRATAKDQDWARDKARLMKHRS
jgi:SsrA-binding protein